MSRTSYRGLMTLPAWGLYKLDGQLVATVRAPRAQDARGIFRRAELKGDRVRKVRS